MVDACVQIYVGQHGSKNTGCQRGWSEHAQISEKVCAKGQTRELLRYQLQPEYLTGDGDLVGAIECSFALPNGNDQTMHSLNGAHHRQARGHRVAGRFW